MKKTIIIILIITLTFCIIYKVKAKIAEFPLLGKTIIIDPGHGGKDPGTIDQELLEKDLNLLISLKLEKTLSSKGASVIMTRDGDYDLSTPNASRRKKSDFDNRIDLINNSFSNIYLSIHINHLEDTSYYGGQVFYHGENNKKLAEIIQKELNSISHPRSIKPMPDIYMYRRLKIKGVLIECGFISNKKEREKLKTNEYQQELASAITRGVINYFT